MTPVVQLDDVVKEYPGHPPVQALRGVSFTVEQGEMVAICGPSGSGKSTMLSLIGALDRPTEGTVKIDGVDLSALADRRRSALRGQRIGFVFQQFHLIPTIDAVANVALGLTYAGIPAPDRRRRAVEMLQRVGLGERLDHRPSHLSGGQSQRVAIARALVGEPSLLLADEPTGNLDSHTSTEIMSLLHQLHDDGVTIVLITHDDELARSLPRQIHLLDGQLTAPEAVTS